jgi:hypothetical protein
LGLDYVGPAPYDPDFVVSGETIRAGSGLNPTGYVMYEYIFLASGQREEGSMIIAPVDAVILRESA